MQRIRANQTFSEIETLELRENLVTSAVPGSIQRLRKILRTKVLQ
jgi:hypothetical protein